MIDMPLVVIFYAKNGAMHVNWFLPAIYSWGVSPCAKT
jgi:hypothetical protein